MKIVVVSHEADFTGAPRVAFDMASALSRSQDVTLISKRKGPLIKLPKYANLKDNYIVLEKSADSAASSFSERVREATATLKKLRPNLVYANSAASFEWCVAARRLRVPCVLHVHEMAQTLRSLLALDILKIDFPKYVDLVVSASQETADALTPWRENPSRATFCSGLRLRPTTSRKCRPPMHRGRRTLPGVSFLASAPLSPCAVSLRPERASTFFMIPRARCPRLTSSGSGPSSWIRQ